MNTIIQVRIDAESKKEAEAILNQMGMTLNEGIRIFVRQIIHQRALPFQPSLAREPREEIKQEMKRVDDYASGKKTEDFYSFNTVEAAMNDLLGE